MTLVLILLAFSPFQDADRGLTGVERTEHFTIRYRPGSRAAAAVDRIAVMAERDFASITRALAVKPDGGLELHLYDDLAELVAVTRTSGNAGFSAGNASHIPYDNDQTRFHEMVHIIAYRMPKSGPEERNLFFAEGLANALLEFVHGVHVHAVAAFELKWKSLPALADVTGADFYEWMKKHPGLNAYDVAGSYFRHLIDTHGIEKVKAHYTGTSAKDAFGATEGELEAAWRKHLEGYKLRPEVEVLLRRRRGEAADFKALDLDPDKRLPPELLGKPEDWKRLTFTPRADSGWKAVGDALEGFSGTPDWVILKLRPRDYRSAVVRAKIRPADGCVGVQLQFGPKCQAMLTNAGTFVWKEGVTALDNSERISGRREIDLILERRGGEVAIWIDGIKIVSGAASDEAGVIGIGVAGGTATFEKIRVRELK